MPIIKVLNQEGNFVKDLELPDNIFNVTGSMQVVYDVVNAERAAKRQGTHDTKGRSEIRGGGKKPWRQKGTGRARQGSIRAPQWRGGGIVFGPTPRSHAVKVNRKVVKLAKQILLSNKLQTNHFLVVDDLKLETFKTKEFIQILSNLKVEGKIVVILAEENTNVFKASNNIPNVYAQSYRHLSVYDLINADYYILTEEACLKYQDELKVKKDGEELK